MTEQQVEAAPAAVEDAAPIRVEWVPVPRVNLLPPEVLEGRRFRRAQYVMGAAVLSTLVVVGGAVFWAQQGVQDAQAELDGVQARVRTLQAEQARYVAVPKLIAQVEGVQASRKRVMAADVLWYRYLNEVDGARPTGVTISQVTFGLTGSAEAPATDPVSKPGIGTLTITGSGRRFSEVADWLDSLDGVGEVSSTFLSGATRGEGSVDFTSGAVFSKDALSHRYDKESR
jgi:outer membrane murein-binding lipoprotein Lpp